MKSSQIVVALDIDGTLVNLTGSGARAMGAAVRSVLNREDVPELRFDGKTDRGIISRLLQECFEDHLEAGSSEQLLQAIYKQYLALLPKELARTPFTPTPGASELIDALKGDPLVKVGLVTGNIEAAAKLKLGSAQLPTDFEFGAFGDEVFERTELVRLGLEQAGSTSTSSLAASFFMVGDTLSDIRAARACGARAIAVATGPYSAAELDAESPEAVYASAAEALADRFWCRKKPTHN